MPNSSIASAGRSQTPEPKAIGYFELGLLFILLILFSEGFLPRLISSNANADGSALLRLLWLPVYAIVLGAMVWKLRDISRTALRMPFMLALLAITAVSFLWSIDSGLTQRRSLAVIMTTAAGLFMGTRYRWQTMLRLFGAVWLSLAVASFLASLLAPGFGLMQEVHVGAWKGFYYEKNQLGGHMARASLLFAFLCLMDKQYRGVWTFALLLSVFLILMTTSKTSLLGMLLGFGVLLIGAWMKKGVRIALLTTWLGVILGGVFLGLLVFAPELVFGLLGRDPSLTGRTDIWATLMDFISKKPLFGYGYGAFWAPGSGPGEWVRDVLEWDAPTAHNGWLEVAVALGLIGLGFLVLDFLMTLVRAVRSSIDTWTGLFALGVCLQFLLFSASESISLQQNSITWLTYSAIAAKLANRPRNMLAITPIRQRQPLRTLPRDAA